MIFSLKRDIFTELFLSEEWLKKNSIKFLSIHKTIDKNKSIFYVIKNSKNLNLFSEKSGKTSETIS